MKCETIFLRRKWNQKEATECVWCSQEECGKQWHEFRYNKIIISINRRIWEECIDLCARRDDSFLHRVDLIPCSYLFFPFSARKKIIAKKNWEEQTRWTVSLSRTKGKRNARRWRSVSTSSSRLPWLSNQTSGKVIIIKQWHFVFIYFPSMRARRFSFFVLCARNSFLLWRVHATTARVRYRSFMYYYLWLARHSELRDSFVHKTIVRSRRNLFASYKLWVRVCLRKKKQNVKKFNRRHCRSVAHQSHPRTFL